MKGDARNKFEFEEDNEANGSCFDNNYLEKLKKKGVPETYQTFKNSQTNPRSIEKYGEDLSSDDSELLDNGGDGNPGENFSNDEDNIYDDAYNDPAANVRTHVMSYLLYRNRRSHRLQRLMMTMSLPQIQILTTKTATITHLKRRQVKAQRALLKV